jgi:hypothetical protein
LLSHLMGYAPAVAESCSIVQPIGDHQDELDRGTKTAIISAWA